MAKEEYLHQLSIEGRVIKQLTKTWESRAVAVLDDKSRDERNPEISKINNLLLEARRLLREYEDLAEKYFLVAKPTPRRP